MKDDIDFRTRFSKTLTMYQFCSAYGMRSVKPLRHIRHCVMQLDQMDMPVEEKRAMIDQAMQVLVIERDAPMHTELLEDYKKIVLNTAGAAVRHSATREDAHEQIAQIAQACIETVAQEPDQDVRRAYVTLAQEVARKENWDDRKYAFIAEGSGLTENSMDNFRVKGSGEITQGVSLSRYIDMGEMTKGASHPDQEIFDRINLN